MAAVKEGKGIFFRFSFEICLTHKPNYFHFKFKYIFLGLQGAKSFKTELSIDNMAAA
jgi:hypothetical protein